MVKSLERKRLVAAGALEGEEDVAKFLEGAVGADLGGADGAFEDGGDFGEGEFLKAGEEEDLAGVVVEAVEGEVEEGVVVAGGGVVAGVGAVVGMIGEVLRVSGDGSGGGFAEVVGGAAAGEVIHPGGEAAVVAVGVPVFEHALEDDLRDVLGGGALAGEFDEKAEKGAVVAFEQDAEGVEFAVAHGEHEVVVGERFGGGGHGVARLCGFNHGCGGMNTNICGLGDHGGGKASLW